MNPHNEQMERKYTKKEKKNNRGQAPIKIRKERMLKEIEIDMQ
jgi:hypothetical protein